VAAIVTLRVSQSSRTVAAARMSASLPPRQSEATKTGDASF
jgi:hypothetical protein